MEKWTPHKQARLRLSGPAKSALFLVVANRLTNHRFARCRPVSVNDSKNRCGGIEAEAIRQ